MADARERTPPSFETVWAMFQELAEQSRETDKKLKEIAEDTRKTIKEMSAELKESGLRFEKQLEKSDLRLAKSKEELDRQMADLGRRFGDLGNRFGELAEHLVAPSINEKFNALGYHFDAVYPGGLRIDGPGKKTLAEIDLLLQNAANMVAVEVKTKLLDKHIDEHIKWLEVLRAWADKHHDRRRIRGAVAGAIVPPGVRDYALDAGLYVIVQTGDTVKIDIPEGFVPRQW
jgi:hypothetical protein